MLAHYKVLGVEADASRREISAAYRRLAKKYHPDKGGDPEKFHEVTLAYNALKNLAELGGQDNEEKPRGRSVEVGRRPLRARVAGSLRGRAFYFLTILAFLLGVVLLDAGDGIHEELNPPLLAAGGASILLSVGFFANRKRPYLGVRDAMKRALLSFVHFIFDVVMRVYFILVLAFSVVALVALINWVKKHYLHILPHHF